MLWCEWRSKRFFLLFRLPLHELSGCGVKRLAAPSQVVWRAPLPDSFSSFTAPFVVETESLAFASRAMRDPAPFNLQIKTSPTFRRTFPFCFEPLRRDALDAFPQGWRCGTQQWNATSNLLFLPVRASTLHNHRGFAAHASACTGQQEGRVCLIYETKCHLHFDGCLLRESVLIVPHNSVLSLLLGLWPDSPTCTPVHLRIGPGTMRVLPCLFTGPQWAGPPGAGVTISPCQICSLNSIAPLSSPPCECQRGLSCGFPHSLRLGYLAWLLLCLPPSLHRPGPARPFAGPAIVPLSKRSVSLRVLTWGFLK